MKDQYLYNNEAMKLTRRSLRQNTTEHERILWNKLKSKQLHGFRFLRQYSVGRYILDFYCPEQRLAIELDGSQHIEDAVINYDKARVQFLEGEDIKVLRFWNLEIKQNLYEVLERILWALEGTPSNNPS